jgi:hypothetical protein
MEALEKACAATPGWKTMARGGSLNEPTMGGRPAGPAVNLPPPRRPRRHDATTTAERVQRRKSNFLPFLLAILMAAALLALIGWQAGPWTIPGRAPGGASTIGQQAAPTQPPPVQQPPAQPPPPSTAGGAQEAKPSPMLSAPAASPEPNSTAQAQPVSPAENPARQPAEPPAGKQIEKPASKMAASEAPAAMPPRPKAAPRPTQSAQPVTVISSPGGATAMLDGRSDTACTTPCALEAPPGRHSIAIAMPGYQVEHRDVDVGTGPLELPAVMLRAISGTLMLTSDPSGASISVNGRKTPQTTPAQLHLAPGTYRITVEKNGIQATSMVDIGNGETKLLRVSLQP